MGFIVLKSNCIESPDRRTRLLSRLLRPHHRQRRAHRRNAAPGVLVILLEAPGLPLRVEHHELPAVEAPGDRCKARDELVATGLQRERETVGVVSGVAEIELADRLAAARELPVTEQVVGDALFSDRRE